MVEGVGSLGFLALFFALLFTVDDGITPQEVTVIGIVGAVAVLSIACAAWADRAKRAAQSANTARAVERDIRMAELGFVPPEYGRPGEFLAADAGEGDGATPPPSGGLP